MNRRRVRGQHIGMGGAAMAVFMAAAVHGGPPVMSNPPALAAASVGFDPATTVFVVTRGEGSDQPGCGAISAVDIESGAVAYRSPWLSSSRGLSAADDLSAFAVGAAGGNTRIHVVDARDDDAGRWTSLDLRSPRGPHRILGSATAILGDQL